MVTGSPAWKPHATLALVTSWNMAASSPMFHEPKDSPRSAFRSTAAAFQRSIRCRRYLSRDGVRHRPERLLGVGHHHLAHREVAGPTDHRADAEGQGAAQEHRA